MTGYARDLLFSVEITLLLQIFCFEYWLMRTYFLKFNSIFFTVFILYPRAVKAPGRKLLKLQSLLKFLFSFHPTNNSILEVNKHISRISTLTMLLIEYFLEQTHNTEIYKNYKFLSQDFQNSRMCNIHQVQK